MPSTVWANGRHLVGWTTEQGARCGDLRIGRLLVHWVWAQRIPKPEPGEYHHHRRIELRAEWTRRYA